MVLERDLEYHSILEKIEIPLEFYGSNGVVDGGYQYLKEVRENGIDSQVEFLVEVSWDELTYETLFDGLLDLTTLLEIEHLKKFQCTISRGDLWSRFINRKSVPVDIRSTVDLDGEVRSPVTAQTLALTSQTIDKRSTFAGGTSLNGSDTGVASTTFLVLVGGAPVVLNEIQLLDPGQYEFEDPVVTPKLVAEDYGTLVITATGVTTVNASSTGSDDFESVEATLYARKNNEAPVVIGSDIVTGINNDTFVENLDVAGTQTFTNLIPGDRIYLYFEYIIIFEPAVGLGDITYNVVATGVSIVMSQATTFPNSSEEGFYIYDVGYGICDRIGGEGEAFYSDYFGGTFTFNIDYSQNGCGSQYQLFKGLNIRGYSLLEKPFSLSFDDWWEGANNIFNLGLGYEVVSFTVGGGGGGFNKEVIRVEEREYFYDDGQNSVQLEDVEAIEISYDPQFLYTSIKIGYQTWDVEGPSGIDDPQTVHTYATRFKTVGSKNQKDISILSSFVAASLAIEQTRRMSAQISKDWKLDNNTIIIQTSAGAVRLYSAGLITDLDNAATRYNVRLTPASNFERHRNFLANAFQDYTSDVFRFTSGEGNTDMTFNNPAAVGCDAEAGTAADENANILIGTDHLFLPVIFKFTHPLTWIEYRTIRDQRKNSIGITWYDNSNTLRSSKLFIKKLNFDINNSKGSFECWVKTFG